LCDNITALKVLVIGGNATVQHILATWGEPPPGFQQRPLELSR